MRYKPPVIRSNRPRFAGYNANRQREARPLAAEVNQAARESEPVFETPMPEAPPRAPVAPVSEFNPAWLQEPGGPSAPRAMLPGGAPQPAMSMRPLRQSVDTVAQPDVQSPLSLMPGMAEQMAVPSGDYARDAYQRHVPGVSPGVDAGLSQMAGQGLEAPDLAGLGEDPLPISEGDRFGRTVADAAAAMNFNPSSPNAANVLPGLMSAGLRSIEQPKESEAQAAARNAAAGRNNALAVEVEENAKAERDRKKAQSTEDTARGVRAAQAEADRAALKAERSKLASDQAAARKAKQDLAELVAAHNANLKGLKAVDDERSPGFYEKNFGAGDPRPAKRTAAQKLVDETGAKLQALTVDGGTPLPEGPPAPASKPAADADKFGHQAEVDAKWMSMPAAERKAWVAEAREDLAKEGATEEELDAAKRIIAKAGR